VRCACLTVFTCRLNWTLTCTDDSGTVNKRFVSLPAAGLTETSDFRTGFSSLSITAEDPSRNSFLCEVRIRVVDREPPVVRVSLLVI
jgi:hypothetical protein